MLVAVEYVTVVRWFRENGKNEGTGFKIKPESFTCLKDHVQKEIAFLGTRGTISPFKCKAPGVYLYFLHNLFPRLNFLHALPSGKHTLSPSCSPISCKRDSFVNDDHSIILVFSSDNWEAKHSHTHIQDTSQNQRRRKQRKERKEMFCMSQTLSSCLQ